MRKFLLNIKSKELSYIRFILSDCYSPVFLEKYVDWDKWLTENNKINSLSREIDQSIKRGIYPNKEFEALSISLTEFFKFYLGDFSFDNSLIIVVWNADIFLPIEFLKFSDLNVLNYIPFVKNIPYPKKENFNFSFIYSDGIESSRKEVYALSEIVMRKDDFPDANVEVFPDEYFDSYKSNLISSNYLYFSTHGKINSESRIFLNNRWRNSFEIDSAFRLVFLDACLLGRKYNGLISELLSRGSDYIIASPFELFENQMEHYKAVSTFYEILNPVNIEETFFETRRRSKFFSNFYRIFRGLFHR